jgi:hypothetical protein
VDSPRKSLRSRLSHWAAELLLVFLGAYAAFWLTNYQQHREDVRKHDQLLAALEDEVTQELDGAKRERAEQAKTVAEFRRALEAGEMPPLHPFSFTSGYSATDTATLLQSGGYQLLDVKTLITIRKVESTVRNGLARINHFQKLSDELIWPNLDQDISFFYDPTTRRLRKRFAEYPDALELVPSFFGEYINAQTDLLNQIRAERQRH